MTTATIVTGQAPGEPEGETPEGTEEIRDPQALYRALQAERAERAKYEKEAREARSALTAKEREGMNEQERLRAENEELRGSLQSITEQARGRAVREEIAELAPKVGITDPRLAARLVDMGDVEWAPDGTPRGIEKMLRSLKAEYPLLSVPAGRGGADGGTGTASRAGSAEEINDAIRRRAGR